MALVHVINLDWVVGGEFEFFISNGVVAIGDRVEIQIDNNVDFSSPLPTYADLISADEISNGLIRLSGSIANGNYFARARLVRGVEVSNWSSSISIFIGPLTFSNGPNLNFAEFRTTIGTILTGHAATFEVTGGADSASVSVDQTTGVVVLDTLSDANFDTPGDADTNGVFEFEITATRSADGVQAIEDFTGTLTNVAAKSYTFRGSSSTAGLGIVLTWSQNIGTDACLLILGMLKRNVEGVTAEPVSVVISGGGLGSPVNLTKDVWLFNNTNIKDCGFYSGTIPSGAGTVTITITFAAGVNDFRAAWAWTAVGLDSSIVKDTASSASSNPTMIMSVDGGDFMFAVSYSNSGTNPDFGGDQEPTAYPSQTSTVAIADWLVLQTDVSHSVALTGLSSGITAVASYS